MNATQIIGGVIVVAGAAAGVILWVKWGFLEIVNYQPDSLERPILPVGETGQSSKIDMVRAILTFVDSVPPPEPQPEVVCAWCFPGDTRPGISHGICPRHKAEMEAQL